MLIARRLSSKPKPRRSGMTHVAPDGVRGLLGCRSYKRVASKGLLKTSRPTRARQAIRAPPGLCNRPSTADCRLPSACRFLPAAIRLTAY